MKTDLEILQANRHLFVTNHSDARVYRSYESALSAAQGYGIMAQPQRNLAKDGWAVVVVFEGADGPCWIGGR